VTGMGPDQGENMSTLPTYVEDYRGHEYAIDFIQHVNGITIRIQAGPLPWRPYSDKLYATYSDAFTAGVDEAQRLIDQLAG
jgi:hypothetical protein